MTTDRGLHNRGVFVKTLAAHGVYCRQAGLESPEHISIGERHGGTFKHILRKVIRDASIVGKTQVKLAALECIAIKNDDSRVGGFSPSQWALR